MTMEHYRTVQKATHPSYITAMTMEHYRKLAIQVILLQLLWYIIESHPSKLYYCNDYGTLQKANHPSYITAMTMVHYRKPPIQVILLQ